MKAFKAVDSNHTPPQERTWPEHRRLRRGPELSAEPQKRAPRGALRSVVEAMERAVVTTQKSIEKATPVIQKSLDRSMKAAGVAFARTMKTIDGATAEDQARLFRAYRKLLAAQLDYVDSRIRALDERRPPPPVPQGALDTEP